MAVGRTAYKNIKLGQSRSSFEIDLALNLRAGGTVGDINHSHNLIANIRPYFATTIRAACGNYLNSPLEQTGFCPSFALSADGGTFKHRSRNFLAINTINSSAPNLIESISVSQDVLDQGKTGLHYLENIVKG